MSKAILVIDMPYSCDGCPCYDNEYAECKAGIGDGSWAPRGRQRWCPLKEIDDEVLKQLGVENKKGRWKKIHPAPIYECSVCGGNVMTQDIDAYRYCLHCGAEMERKEE